MARPERRCYPCTTSVRRHVIGFVAFAGLLALAPMDMAQADDTITDGRKQELIRMVRQDCGSCHGMTLKGGLGPPLTPEALRGKPAESLTATILNGRPGTPMPPWNRFVGTGEARWIVNQLLRSFPQE